MNENITVKRISRLAIAAATLAVTTVLAFGAAPAHAVPNKLCSPGPTPSISIADSYSGEEDGGVVFRVELSNRACHYVSVHWATKAEAPGLGSATPSEDYTTSSGKIVFAPGTTQAFASVPLAADGKPEQEETFLVKLSTPAGATLGDATGVMSIFDVLPG